MDVKLATLIKSLNIMDVIFLGLQYALTACKGLILLPLGLQKPDYRSNKCIYDADPSPHPCYQLKLAINLLSDHTHTNTSINALTVQIPHHNFTKQKKKTHEKLLMADGTQKIRH